jgi:hypothetical protein
MVIDLELCFKFVAYRIPCRHLSAFQIDNGALLRRGCAEPELQTELRSLSGIAFDSHLLIRPRDWNWIVRRRLPFLGEAEAPVQRKPPCRGRWPGPHPL